MRVPKVVLKLYSVLAVSVLLSGCVGTVVGAVVDTAVEVVKIPFKVSGAVIDVVTPDELSEKRAGQPAADGFEDTDAALKSEQETLQ